MAEEKQKVAPVHAKPVTATPPVTTPPLATAPRSPTPTPKKGSGKKIALVLLLIIVLFLLARFLIPQALIYLTRAAKPTKYSLSNSYVFGAPMVMTADGKTKSRVSVFLLNDQGLGVPDKQIFVSSRAKGAAAGNVQIDQVKPTTDNFGQSVFEITSDYSGQFEISASVDNLEIPQKVTLTFR